MRESALAVTLLLALAIAAPRPGSADRFGRDLFADLIFTDGFESGTAAAWNGE